MYLWQLTPVFPIYVLAVVTSFLVAILGWRMRPARGTTYFSLMAFGAGIWSLGFLLGFFNTDPQWKFVMLRLEYFGDITSVYFWLLFAISFAQYDSWLTKRIIVLLAIIPILTFAQVLFVNDHDFFYKSFRLIEENGFVRFYKVYNLGFYLWAVYAYLSMIAGSVILVWGVMHRPKLFKTQNFLIALLIIIILVPNSLYITGLKPLGSYDPTPLTFVLAGILLIILLWKYKLFDIVPVAHHLVFKNVRIGVILIDNKLRILEMNPTAENIIGKVQNNVLGTSVSEVLPGLNKILSANPNTPEIKTELILEPGKRIFEIQKTPLLNNKNHAIGNIIMLYEITELKQTLNELNAFAHTVAHDLKSPLAAQWTRIELLKESHLLGDEMVEAYQAISQGANKMMSIVDALLLLADVRNRDNVRLEPINMVLAVDNVLERLGDLVAKSSARIILPDEWTEVSCYQPWIEEVWSNYIANAIKYGGKPPVVEIGFDDEGDRILYWVKDNGKGLSAEEIQSLFTEFKRLERHSKEVSGHGLGLSIVQRIIDRFEGETGVISDGKTGCTFYFTLKK
ncbi:MAG: PAS domain-containing protein [Bacteroidales bacterium]|nr:PAS domain-containing protein [Bacteroidales bacterium]